MMKVMECGNSQSSKTGDLAMDVVRQVCCVYNLNASFEKMGSVKESRAWLHIRDQGRLEGKGDCERNSSIFNELLLYFGHLA